MDKKPIISKLGKKEDSPINKAVRYYSVLSAIGDFNLTRKEIELIAFTAIKGNISLLPNKEEFSALYDSSPAYVGNMISRLKKLNLLIKEQGKIRVNPKIVINFDNDIVLQLTISDG